VILVGAGGHARVLVECLRLGNIPVLGYVCLPGSVAKGNMTALRHFGSDEALDSMDRTAVRLVNGIGSVRSTEARRDAFARFRQAGFSFETVSHPSVIIAPDAILEEGTQVMAGAIVQPGCRIGANAILNTRVSVDHDSVIETHSHLACGVVLSGHVRVGADVHVGTGAMVAQNISIGRGALVGAGSVVLDDVAEGEFVAGVPARRIARVETARS